MNLSKLLLVGCLFFVGCRGQCYVGNSPLKDFQGKKIERDLGVVGEEEMSCAEDKITLIGYRF